MEEEKRLSVRLPKYLHDQFKAAVAANSRTMTGVILDFVTNYVHCYLSPHSTTFTTIDRGGIDEQQKKP